MQSSPEELNQIIEQLTGAAQNIKRQAAAATQDEIGLDSAVLAIEMAINCIRIHIRLQRTI